MVIDVLRKHYFLHDQEGMILRLRLVIIDDTRLNSNLVGGNC